MSQFEEMYNRYWQDVSQFLFRITGYQRQLAEELTQETFYQAMLSFHRYRGDCHIKTWLCQIAKNTYLNAMRKDKKGSRVPMEQIANLILSASDSVAADYEKEELIAYANKVLMQLDGNTRDVLIYRIFTDLSYEQIGALLRISESSAKVIYMRGKFKLQKKLREEYGYEL